MTIALSLIVALSLTAAVAVALAWRAWCIWKLAKEANKEG